MFDDDIGVLVNAQTPHARGQRRRYPFGDRISEDQISEAGSTNRPALYRAQLCTGQQGTGIAPLVERRSPGCQHDRRMLKMGGRCERGLTVCHVDMEDGGIPDACD